MGFKPEDKLDINNPPNNNIMTFLNDNYEITRDETNKIKSSDLLIKTFAFAQTCS